MPAYDYQCQECGEMIEVFHSMMDPPLTDCPSCKQKKLKRVITGGTGVIFKGTGFYINDSKKKTETPKAEKS